MPGFKWSSPQRRVGSRNLDPIPPEIYFEIFGYFNENEDLTAKDVRQNLASLALVCRFFSSIALPRIFSRMEFSGRVQQSDGKTPTTSRFCRALLSNQEPAKSLAQYVKTCTFNLWQNLETESQSMIRSRDAFLSMYCSALSKMLGVESLEFNTVSIDKRFLKAMRKLPHLNSLRFSRCSFAQGLDLNDIQHFVQGINLRKLLVFGCGPNHAFHDAFTRVLNYHFLKSLEVDNWKVIEYLTNNENLLPLEVMTIHYVENPYLLPALFERTPEILALHVYRINMERENEFSSVMFPASTLPKLGLIDCPPSLALLLVPHRPIKKLRLMGTMMSSVEGRTVPSLLPPLSRQFLAAMHESAATIREATIPKHLFLVDSLQRYIPDISDLSISWFHGNWAEDILDLGHANEVEAVLRGIFGDCLPHPSIRRLTLDFGFDVDRCLPYLDLQSQHEILQTIIVHAFPNVEQVNFITCINWRRSHWDGGWRAYVPKSKKKYSFHQWEPIRQKLIDYGGCFATVFDTDDLE